MFLDILLLIVGGLGVLDGLARVIDVEWLPVSYEVPDDEVSLFLGALEIIVGAIVVFFTLQHMRGPQVRPGPGRRAEIEAGLAMVWPLIAGLRARCQPRQTSGETF